MNKYILLIDDNKYLLDVFLIRLAMYLKNYKIFTARNGIQGIEVLKTIRLDFVLTDLDMPEMDGYEFIRYARLHFPGLPVYAMSNDCSPGVIERLRMLGITECIEKPFMVEEVASKIIKRLKAEKSGVPVYDRREGGVQDGLSVKHHPEPAEMRMQA